MYDEIFAQLMVAEAFYATCSFCINYGMWAKGYNLCYFL